MLDADTIQSNSLPDADAVGRIKRLAKQLSRETGIPHQKTLDAIARMAGRSHWGAYATSVTNEEGVVSWSAMDLPGDRRPIFANSALIPGSDVLDGIRAAVDGGRSLAIVGSTSTGKTTMLMRLVMDLDQRANIHFVDADQMKSQRRGNGCTWRFHDVVRWPSGMDETDRRAYIRQAMRDVMGDALSTEPDAVVVDEISTDNGLIILQTGRRILTTVHASDIDEGIEIIARRGMDGMSEADILRRLPVRMARARSKFCFVQVLRDLQTGRRSLGEIRI